MVVQTGNLTGVEVSLASYLPGCPTWANPIPSGASASACVRGVCRPPASLSAWDEHEIVLMIRLGPGTLRHLSKKFPVIFHRALAMC